MSLSVGVFLANTQREIMITAQPNEVKHERLVFAPAIR